MDALVQYTLPLSGLRNGIHEFNFLVDDEFFSHFENSPVRQGKVEVSLIFDKRPDLIVMIFKFKGSVKLECDGCLENFDLALEGEENILVKYAAEDAPQEEGDIVYVVEGAQELKIANYVYEIICLAIPMSKTHDLAGESCNQEMLKYLTAPDEEKSNENPIWDALKSIRKN